MDMIDAVDRDDREERKREAERRVAAAQVEAVAARIGTRRFAAAMAELRHRSAELEQLRRS